MPPPETLLQPTTPEIVATVREMVANARHGALATLSPSDGWPQATRVGLASYRGAPLILVSALAAHTAALRADPRCSLLVGKLGPGDPLAYARATFRCRAGEIARGGSAHGAARSAYLAAHPRAKLYADLGDFCFMQLTIKAASFNAGFGRAYALTAADFG